MRNPNTHTLVAQHAQHAPRPKNSLSRDGKRRWPSRRMGTQQIIPGLCIASQRHRDIDSVLSGATDLSTFLSSIIHGEGSWKVIAST